MKMLASTAFERIAVAADTTREHLRASYEQRRLQAHAWSRVSAAAGLTGFIVVFAALWAILAGFGTAGVVTLIANVVCQTVAVLFYRQANRANTQVAEDLKKLVDAERIHQAIELAHTVESAALRDALKESIIRIALNIHKDPPPKESQ